MKKGKFSKVEISYIQHNRDKSDEELAKDLNRSVDAIVKVVDSLPVVQVETPVVETPTEKPLLTGSNFRKTLVRKTAGQGRSGVTIMTQAASEQSDEAKKRNKFKKRTNEDAIFKPLDPEELKRERNES